METLPLPLLLFLISLTTASLPSDRRRIDSIIHSAALHSYPKHHKTAVPYTVSLPPTLSPASAHAIRFRSGRLRRQGVTFNNFHLPPGLLTRPHSKRLLIVLQNLANLSASFYSLPNHRLISPVLGLLIYDAVTTNSTKLSVKLSNKPIEVKFAGLAEVKEESFCAVFGLDGRVEVEVAGRGRVCFVKGQGHFGLVVKGGRRWKMVVAAAVAAAVGMGLIGLVVVAVVKGRRKEWRMAEMERRGDEDEGLRVSMVGGLRVFTAAAVRTTPAIESEDGFKGN